VFDRNRRAKCCLASASNPHKRQAVSLFQIWFRATSNQILHGTAKYKGKAMKYANGNITVTGL
jgi:hypothetical protein